MRKIYFALGLICLCLFSRPVFANHVYGGEITYTYLGGDSFEIEQSVYRNCSGITGTDIGIEVKPSNAQSFSASLNHFNDFDITPVCSKSCTRCSSSSCSLSWGTSKEVYRGIINLSSYTACEYIISSPAVSTFTLPAFDANYSPDGYSETYLNKCIGESHSSPKFVEDAMTIWCKNQCANTYQHAEGEEGDSLIYEFTFPLRSHGMQAQYTKSYDFYKPFKFDGAPDTAWNPAGCKGIRYDMHSGQILFKPTESGATYLTLKVSQYKKDSTGKYQLAGYVMRNCVFSIIDCPAYKSDGVTLLYPPTITGVNGASETSIIACPDVELMFYLDMQDRNKDDVLFNWDKQIPGASFSVNSGRATFKWTPKKQDVRKEPYYIYTTISDDECPLPAKIETRYAIYVRDSFPEYKYTKIDSGCGKYYFKATPRDPGKSFTYSWSINGQLISTASDFSRRFSKNGIYKIQGYIKVPAGCGKYINDTVTITGFSPFGAGDDTTICSGETIRLKGFGSVGYKWKGKGIVSGDTTYNPAVKPFETTTYHVEGLVNGCIREDSMRVYVINVPDPILSKDTLLCQKPTLATMPTIKATELEGAEYTWSPTTGIVGSTIASSIRVKPTETTTYHLILKTKEGCEYMDSVTVKIGLNQANAGPDVTICEGDKITLKASGGVAYHWTPETGIKNPGEAVTDAEPHDSRYYKVIVTDKYACQSADSMYVKVIPFGGQVSEMTSPICCGDTVKLSAYGGTIYKWKSSSTLLNVNSQFPSVFPSENTWYYVTVSNSNGCSHYDSVLVKIDPACVWPGDANNDQRADYLDLLSIGVGFNQNGPARASVSNQWRSYAATGWAKKTDDGVNYSRIDCNGDGIIDKKDIMAIYANYGKSYGIPSSPVLVGISTDPVLRWAFEKHTYYAGDTVRATLILGSDTKPVIKGYGVGWKYTYNDQWMKPNSFRFAYDCGPFCGGPSELRMHKANGAGGEASLVRTHQRGFTGNGELATISYVLKDTNSAVYSTTGEKIYARLNYAQLIDSTGKVLGLQIQRDSAMVYKRSTGMPDVGFLGQKIRVYPNPVSHTLTVEVDGVKINSVIMFSALGKKVYTSQGSLAAGRLQIPVTNLAPGFYFITIQTPEGAISRKIIVER